MKEPASKTEVESIEEDIYSQPMASTRTTLNTQNKNDFPQIQFPSYLKFPYLHITLPGLKKKLCAHRNRLFLMIPLSEHIAVALYAVSLLCWDMI